MLLVLCIPLCMLGAFMLWTPQDFYDFTHWFKTESESEITKYYKIKTRIIGTLLLVFSLLGIIETIVYIL